MSLKFCTNCGRKLIPEEKFCSQCGQKLEENETSGGEELLQTTTESSKQPFIKNKKFVSLIVAGLFALFLIYFFLIDTPHNSKVKGVSDEVYYELVEQYFYLERQMDMLENGGLEAFIDWMKSQEQYKEAEEVAEKEDIVVNPGEVFPNTLLLEFMKNRESFSSKETELVGKIQDMYRLVMRRETEEYKMMSEELKEEMQIKDSYNPFDE
ncbi:putative CopG family antitoxin [Salirhabdus euzebyi]|uniref:Putative CopG family antitoxin n=1 Tax=Salirhabdus euzebyi TaxID=394506 RepID=A0A841Q5Y0_9BACI|nr:zinc-ribbon domain-containing protein [Salirhabdus euzebyi]MBB6453722.1 putative CopG family antitoxin [Salirhabdus euzebyi]